MAQTLIVDGSGPLRTQSIGHTDSERSILISSLEVFEGIGCLKDILPQYHLNVRVVVDKRFIWLQMWKPVLEIGNVNGFGTNAQTVFDKRPNPKRVFKVVEFGKHVYFDLLRGNGFRRIEAVYQNI